MYDEIVRRYGESIRVVRWRVLDCIRLFQVYLMRVSDVYRESVRCLWRRLTGCRKVLVVYEESFEEI